MRQPLLLSGGCHLGSVRRSLTARMAWRAVAIDEMPPSFLARWGKPLLLRADDWQLLWFRK